LSVVEELELQYCEHPGLNLTWATREGLARHRTRYDVPAETREYDKYRQPSLESQVGNVADLIAYSTHDVEDALVAKLLEIDDLETVHIAIWETSWHKARDEFDKAHPNGLWPGVDKPQLLTKRARRHLIDYLIRDVVVETKNRVQQYGVETLEEARATEHPLVAFSPEVAAQVDTLLDFMMEKVYRGPTVARQNHRASHILGCLFEALSKDYSLLPTWVQERIRDGSEPYLEVARFLARLTDRSAVDLYAELFEPSERAMGHRIPQ
jgi:dGTPase